MQDLTVVFVCIAAVLKIFSWRYKTAIITTICDASLGQGLCPSFVPSAAASYFSVVLSVPVIPNPPVI